MSHVTFYIFPMSPCHFIYDPDVTFYSFFKSPRRTSTTFKVVVSHFVFYPCEALLIITLMHVLTIPTGTYASYTHVLIIPILPVHMYLGALQLAHPHPKKGYLFHCRPDQLCSGCPYDKPDRLQSARPLTQPVLPQRTKDNKVTGI